MGNVPASCEGARKSLLVTDEEQSVNEGAHHDPYKHNAALRFAATFQDPIDNGESMPSSASPRVSSPKTKQGPEQLQTIQPAVIQQQILSQQQHQLYHQQQWQSQRNDAAAVSTPGGRTEMVWIEKDEIDARHRLSHTHTPNYYNPHYQNSHNSNQQQQAPSSPAAPPSIMALTTSLTSIEPPFYTEEHYHQYRIEYNDESLPRQQEHNGFSEQNKFYQDGGFIVPNTFATTEPKYQALNENIVIQDPTNAHQELQHYQQLQQQLYPTSSGRNRPPSEYYSQGQGVVTQMLSASNQYNIGTSNSQNHEVLVETVVTTETESIGVVDRGNIFRQAGLPMSPSRSAAPSLKRDPGSVKDSKELSNEESIENLNEVANQRYPLIPKKLTDTDEMSAMTDMAHDGDDESTVIRRRDGLRATIGVEVLRRRISNHPSVSTKMSNDIETTSDLLQKYHEEPQQTCSEVKDFIHVINAEEEYSEAINQLEHKNDANYTELNMHQSRELTAHEERYESNSNYFGSNLEAIELEMDDNSVHAGDIFDDNGVCLRHHAYSLSGTFDGSLSYSEKRSVVRVEANFVDNGKSFNVSTYVIDGNLVDASNSVVHDVAKENAHIVGSGSSVSGAYVNENMPQQRDVLGDNRNVVVDSNDNRSTKSSPDVFIRTKLARPNSYCSSSESSQNSESDLKPNDGPVHVAGELGETVEANPYRKIPMVKPVGVTGNIVDKNDEADFEHTNHKTYGVPFVAGSVAGVVVKGSEANTLSLLNHHMENRDDIDLNTNRSEFVIHGIVNNEEHSVKTYPAVSILSGGNSASYETNSLKSFQNSTAATTIPSVYGRDYDHAFPISRFNPAPVSTQGRIVQDSISVTDSISTKKSRQSILDVLQSRPSPILNANSQHSSDTKELKMNYTDKYKFLGDDETYYTNENWNVSLEERSRASLSFVQHEDREEHDDEQLDPRHDATRTFVSVDETSMHSRTSSFVLRNIKKSSSQLSFDEASTSSKITSRSFLTRSTMESKGLQPSLTKTTNKALQILLTKTTSNQDSTSFVKKTMTAQNSSMLLNKGGSYDLQPSLKELLNNDDPNPLLMDALSNDPDHLPTKAESNDTHPSIVMKSNSKDSLSLLTTVELNDTQPLLTKAICGHSPSSLTNVANSNSHSSITNVASKSSQLLLNSSDPQPLLMKTKSKAPEILSMKATIKDPESLSPITTIKDPEPLSTKTASKDPEPLSSKTNNRDSLPLMVKNTKFTLLTTIGKDPQPGVRDTTSEDSQSLITKTASIDPQEMLPETAGNDYQPKQLQSLPSLFCDGSAQRSKGSKLEPDGLKSFMAEPRASEPPEVRSSNKQNVLISDDSDQVNCSLEDREDTFDSNEDEDSIERKIQRDPSVNESLLEESVQAASINVTVNDGGDELEIQSCVHQKSIDKRPQAEDESYCESKGAVCESEEAYIHPVIVQGRDVPTDFSKEVLSSEYVLTCYTDDGEDYACGKTQEYVMKASFESSILEDQKLIHSMLEDQKSIHSMLEDRKSIHSMLEDHKSIHSTLEDQNSSHSMLEVQKSSHATLNGNGLSTNSSGNKISDDNQPELVTADGIQHERNIVNPIDDTCQSKYVVSKSTQVEGPFSSVINQEEFKEDRNIDDDELQEADYIRNSPLVPEESTVIDSVEPLAETNERTTDSLTQNDQSNDSVIASVNDSTKEVVDIEDHSLLNETNIATVSISSCRATEIYDDAYDNSYSVVSSNLQENGGSDAVGWIHTANNTNKDSSFTMTEDRIDMSSNPESNEISSDQEQILDNITDSIITTQPSVLKDNDEGWVQNDGVLDITVGDESANGENLSRYTLTSNQPSSPVARVLAIVNSGGNISESRSADFDGIDIKFVEQYEETFNAFLSKYPFFMKMDPDFVEMMRVAKLQKILAVTAEVEAELVDHIETLESQKKHTTSHYQSKLLEAAKKKAAREIQLQQELNTIQQATQLMETKLTWQVVSKSESRAKKYVQILEKLDATRTIDEHNPLAILPDIVATRPILDAITAPAVVGWSKNLTEEQMKDLRQFQVDNAFLNAETMVLERKLSYLQTNAKQYAWIDSVFRRLNSKQHKMLKHRYQSLSKKTSIVSSQAGSAI